MSKESVQSRMVIMHRVAFVQWTKPLYLGLTFQRCSNDLNSNENLVGIISFIEEFFWHETITMKNDAAVGNRNLPHSRFYEQS